ncbi:hypothetical protein [Rhodoligotrophos defluvii]|uniref:hypothetical protein n=1 Tax=Rhodoligotrophos defluvii TaxID=2561934 RepID=UPI001960D86D|nr:hypothetical protein [Rhodoligotrophos defluvii]
MAAEPIGALRAEMSANAAQFEEDMGRARRAVQEAARGMQASMARAKAQMDAASASINRLASVGRAFAGGLGLGIATTGLAELPRLLREMVAEAAGVGDLADRIGMTAEEVQQLQYAARQSGSDVQTLNDGLQRFALEIGKAADGSGKLKEILEANGIALRDAEGRVRPLNDLLRDYADLVAGARSEQERLQLVYSAFGRTGQDLVLMLKDGATGLKSAAREARDLGVVIEDDLIKQARAFDDALDRLTATIETRLKVALLNGADWVSTLADALSDVGSQLKQNINSWSLWTKLIDALPKDPLAPEVELLSPEQRQVVNTAAKGNRITPPKLPPPPDPDRRDGNDERDRQAEAIARVISALEFEQAQLQRSALDQEIHNQLRAAGVDLTSKQGQRIAELVTQIEQQRQAMMDARLAQEAFNDSMRYLGEIGVDTFASLVSGTESFSDAIRNLAQELGLAALKAALLGEGPLAGLFGTAQSGGSLGGILNAFSRGQTGGPTNIVPTGFARGGSFEVGGAGGIDSQLVVFKATPGELVTVDDRRGPEAGDQPGRVVAAPRITFNVMANDAESFRRSESQIAAMLTRAVARGQRNL